MCQSTSLPLGLTDWIKQASKHSELNIGLSLIGLDDSVENGAVDYIVSYQYLLIFILILILTFIHIHSFNYPHLISHSHLTLYTSISDIRPNWMLTWYSNSNKLSHDKVYSSQLNSTSLNLKWKDLNPFSQCSIIYESKICQSIKSINLLALIYEYQSNQSTNSNQ